jgi:DNA topoisomerase I
MTRSSTRPSATTRESTITSAAEAESARRAGLRYVLDSAPGIRRQRAGKGFTYLSVDGRRIRDADLLARIRSLAVPPAYTRVWICADPRGHLQATGRDARQRKQYRYHPQWRSVRDDGKFARMAEFGAALPRLRRRLRTDLARPGLPRDKVLGVVVALLAGTLARVGNEEYARDNRSFGLTTLRTRHVAFVRGGRLSLRFRGKSGLEHDLTVNDARLARIVRRCRELPGQALFQYIDDDGQRQPIDSGMVNAYLQDAMGSPFTAKDFRTWGGTLAAIAALVRTPLPESGGERAMAAAIVDVIKQVAGELRNTPAVCRKSYIHPLVFEAWRDGRLHRLAARSGSGPRQLEGLALKLLRGRR